MKPTSGAEIRQSFIDFFVEKGHTHVPSSSLVPGGDQTLLFTNAGMVQFKDVFLGTEKRGYSKAVNSQKCMRVAGKHNDLDDVGRDDYHHTFFEMLGNWSFGDYYKKEAIAWAWELLTERWGLDKSKLWLTCFKDEKGEIPTDNEAASLWAQQSGIVPEHIQYFGRKENFWEMAETGPCGPCSEIHIDTGVEFCDKQRIPGHVCSVNGGCKRFLELWNLVFIQYNRINPSQLEPLPAKHVDTGMGFERIVSIIQKVRSNYRTDLLFSLIQQIQDMTGDSDQERDENFTPYRVIADHVRTASFLIADGVVPGNTGRNYVCRMIIRRGARFGSKIGLNEPFMAKVAEIVIQNYGEAYPELRKNQNSILENLTREEIRFERTVESGISNLDELLKELREKELRVLDGQKAFDLYATHGLPLEITRDIARENGLEVDEKGFLDAMDEHRVNSGVGKAFGLMGGDDVAVFREIFEQLLEQNSLKSSGVIYDPYGILRVEGIILAIIKDGVPVPFASPDDLVEVIIPKTCFYIESGGQVSDNGIISDVDGSWEINVTELRKPAAGLIVHVGKVTRGKPKVNDHFIAQVDGQRRQDIMRNHTATHLLHAELQKVLGDHARQAGSLVSPDHLRFDFTHPSAVTSDQLELIESQVNQAILDDFELRTEKKSLNEAINDGAMALFGEKYGEDVRAVAIGEEKRISYELCGGTHVRETGEIGYFVITSEGSVAAGIRRIEAVTGRKAYELIQNRIKVLKKTAVILDATLENLQSKAISVMDEVENTRKHISELEEKILTSEFSEKIHETRYINSVPVLSVVLNNAKADNLRHMADKFKEEYTTGIIVLGSVVEGKPVIIAVVTDDLVKRGLNAGELLKEISPIISGSGGGKPNMAQAGGKNPDALQAALNEAYTFLESRLN